MIRRLDKVLLSSVSLIALASFPLGGAYAQTAVGTSTEVTANTTTSYDFGAANGTLTIDSGAVVGNVTSNTTSGNGTLTFGNGTNNAGYGAVLNSSANLTGSVGNLTKSVSGVSIANFVTGGVSGTVNTTGNVTVGYGSTLTISGASGIGGSVVFAGTGNGTLILAGGSAITGNVVTSGVGNGTLNLSGGNTTITGTVGGANANLGTMTLTGNNTTAIAGATYVVNTTTFATANNTATLVFSAASTNITGNITTATNGCGTLNITGNGTTITGEVGSSSTGINKVNLAAANQTLTVSANSLISSGTGDLYTKNGVNMSLGGQTLTVAGNLTGGVTFGVAPGTVTAGAVGGTIAFAGTNSTVNTTATNVLPSSSISLVATTTVNGTGTINVNGNNYIGNIGNLTGSIGALNLNGTETIGTASIYTAAATLNSGSATTLAGNVTLSTNGATAEAVTLKGATLNLGTNTLTLTNAVGGGAVSLTNSGGSNSTLGVTLNSTASGQIVGNGTVNFAGGAAGSVVVTPTLTAGYLPAAGAQYILTNTTAAPTSIAGLTTASSNPLISYTVALGTAGTVAVNGTETATETVLTANRVNASAISGVASTSVGALNAAMSAGAPTTLATALANLTTPAQVAAAGAQLRPEINNAATESVLGATNAAFTTVGNRLGDLRLASNGGTGINTGDVMSGLGIWGQGFGGAADQDTRQGVTGYNATYGGFAAGIDTKVADQIRAGLAFSFARAYVGDANIAGSNNQTVNNYQATVYGTYTGAPWYVDGALAYGFAQYDTVRDVNFQTFSDQLTSNHKGYTFAAKASGGYPIPVEEYVVTPTLGGTYAHVTQDGYTESSLNGAGLTYNSQTLDSFKSSLGAKLSRSFAGTDTYAGVTFTPEVRAAWQHEFITSGVTTTAVFSGGGSSFATTGVASASEAALIGIGLKIATKGDLTLSANYDAEIKDAYFGQTGLLQVRQDF